MSKPILVLAATPLEIDLLKDTLKKKETSTVARRDCLSGQIGGRDVKLLETGIGLVNTAQVLTGALETAPHVLVLQVGVGGAYPGSNLLIGDIAVATEENYGELGIETVDSWESAEAIGIPLLEGNRDYFNTFPLDSARVARAETLIRGWSWHGIPPFFCKGPFVTVQQCTGTESKGRQLAERFGAICENMEGASAAHVCARYETPFLEVRGISNPVEDRNRDAWDLPLAAERAQQAVLTLIKDLDL